MLMLIYCIPWPRILDINYPKVTIIDINGAFSIYFLPGCFEGALSESDREDLSSFLLLSV